MRICFLFQLLESVHPHVSTSGNFYLQNASLRLPLLSSNALPLCLRLPCLILSLVITFMIASLQLKGLSLIASAKPLLLCKGHIHKLWD